MPSDLGDGAQRRLVPVSDAVCIEPRVDSTRCAAHWGRASNLAPAQRPAKSAGRSAAASGNGGCGWASAARSYGKVPRPGPVLVS